MIKLYFEKLFYVSKITAYTTLGIMLYSNLIGPEGVAELLKVRDPSEEGLEHVGLLLPKYVLYWTLGTVALEVIGNLYKLFQFTKYYDEPLTHGEFRDKETKRDTEQFKTNLRIAKIEGKLNNKRD